MNQPIKLIGSHLILRWFMATASVIAAWLVISPSLDRRSGLGLDLTAVAPSAILSLEDVAHRYEFFDKNSTENLCPGPSCPLNSGLVTKMLPRERKVSSNFVTLITTEGWSRTLYLAWDVHVPEFIQRASDPIAFDFYGISGKSWRFFVNGKFVASGAGTTQIQPIVFVSPDERGKPMTIGFEIDVGRALAPGLVHIGQAFLSEPETAGKFRLAYRGLDKAAILPTATGFALIAMLASLGCFFTPFYREILAFSIFVTAFNWRLLIVNDMAPFPAFMKVDFVTIDAMLRSALLASMWAFWGLYFRAVSRLRWIPVIVYSVFSIICYVLGRTGVGLDALVYYVKTIDIHQSFVFGGASFLALKTSLSTRQYPWASFRANTSLIIGLATALISASFLARFVINSGGLTWESFRTYEPIFFFANYSVRAFIIGQGILIALEWALIVGDRQVVLQRFGTIVDPRMMTNIIRGQENSSRRVENVIALFVDLRSFTKICDVYDPDLVTSTLNEYLNIVTRCVQRREGVVDKFVGDAVMATWGVPTQGFDDPTNALRAAISIRLEIQNLNNTRIANGLFPIQIGMGIHIGEGIFGAIGSGLRVDHTVIGSTVNIASRIQNLTKLHECDILVTREFYEQVKDTCLADNLGFSELRGMSRPIEVLKIIGATMQNGQDMVIADETLEAAISTRTPGIISNTPPNLVTFEHPESPFEVRTKRKADDIAA